MMWLRGLMACAIAIPLRRWLTTRADAFFLTLMALFLSIPIVFLLFSQFLEGVDPTSVVGLYAALVILGYYVAILNVVLGVAFLLLLAWPRVAMVASGSVLSLALFWFVVDGSLYRTMRFHADAFWLPLTVTSPGSLGISTPMRLQAAAALAATGVLVWFLFRVAMQLPHKRPMVLGMTAVCMLSFLGSQVIHILAYERNDTRITAITPRLPFYYPVHSRREAERHNDLLPIINESGMGTAINSLAYPSTEFSLARLQAARRPNILLLFLESWRADCMNEVVSPNIHRMAQRSAVFNNHFSSGNCTTAGVFSPFYGIHSTYWTAVKANATHIDNPVLIDALEANGYDFGIFADSDFDRHKIKDTIFRGIDVHEDFAGDTPDMNDRDLNDRLLAFALDAHIAGRPFFGFAFYKSTHFGYHYPKDVAHFSPAYKLNIINPDGRRDRQTYFNDYRNAVYYTDMLIGHLLDELEAAGVLEDTIVVITSDHGEEFDDNHEGYWGHVGNFTGYQIRVPLVVYVPWAAPRQINQVTAHVDIAPTLIREGIGCDVDIASYSNGCDLFGPLPSERPIIVSSYVNYAVVTGEDVTVVYPMYVEKHKLWDIRAQADGPRPDLARLAIEEMSCFYRTNSLAHR
ncbi:MAG TPA: sulfatase-like hydrolase/transferase [Phycisphaerae bacterium]|nr:sulfatase-like hydrolase/transferase [Phycisphaerae bacterium]